MGNDSAYWEWRDEQLQAVGRAKGGEPCRVCDQPVPANAHWKHRDRHVCSPHCNLKLNRRFNRQVERGEFTPPPVFALDPQPARQPRVFRTLAAEAPFPYELFGYSPKPGDLVERHESLTSVHRAVDLPPHVLPSELRSERWDLDRVAAAVHVQTGSAFYYLTDASWTPTSLILGPYLGLRHLETFAPFEAEGGTWRWYGEIIRDVDANGQDYTWSAYVCGRHSVPRMWTAGVCLKIGAAEARVPLGWQLRGAHAQVGYRRHD